VTTLTERERAVLELLPAMQPADELAQDLAISVNTVKTHLRAIYQKLGTDNRRDSVLQARRAGLLPPD
jgi:LuxR family maltose regulon positive regulatory protein